MIASLPLYLLLMALSAPALHLLLRRRLRLGQEEQSRLPERWGQAALARGAKSALTSLSGDLFAGLSKDLFTGLAIILGKDPALNPPNADRKGVLCSSGSAL